MEECKGCFCYRETFCSLNTVPHLPDGKDCPCLTCLVKGMCGSDCDAFRKYKLLHEMRLYGDKYSRVV